ncbi:alpha/beta fold hydrolase [Nocardioides sp. NPDC051685]|uniref:alpha/beta fold hydrolase n=1 Tax=Nocardioides sp. NPDC051685 TaxID=3364334 RepID=UPI003799A8B7
MTTFVLITGAWHGGWAWRPVAAHLRAAGHQVLAPTLPGLADGDDPTGLELSDVIDHVAGLVESQDLTDITLIGHSWGGYVITGVANAIPDRVAKVVYWSAFVPAAGVPLYDECPPHYQELFTTLAAASGNNTISMPLEVLQGGFVQDASEDVQKLVHSLLGPQPMQYFTATVEPLDQSHPFEAVYLLSEDDIGLPPGEYGWARFAGRLGVEPVLVPGSHEALLTRPADLAEAFLKA